MPSLLITKSYANSSVLNESDLNNVKSSLETFCNTTKLDASNVQCDSVGLNLTSTGANAVATQMTSTGSLTLIQKATTTEGYRIQGTSTGTAAVTTPNYVTSSAIVLASGASGTAADITNATVTITARNRPIMILLQSTTTTSATSSGALSVESAGTTSIYLVKDGVTMEKVTVQSPLSAQYLPLSMICFIDTAPGTGSKVYKLQYLAHSGALSINDAVLFAVEL